jgi:hypothetical protein
MSLGFLAALALQRRHRPDVTLVAHVRGAQTEHRLTWRPVTERAGAHVDQSRATEDGAEAVALGLVHEACRWVAKRRLQRGQHGDWLLSEHGSGRKLVFEVGGIDDGSLTAKLNAEVAQVKRSALPYDRAACVVRFRDVSAILVEVRHDAR